MNGRAWGGGAAALLLCAAFAHYCVRIVPADAPQRASAPPEPRAAPPRADRPVATGALLIPVEGALSISGRRTDASSIITRTSTAMRRA